MPAPTTPALPLPPHADPHLRLLTAAHLEADAFDAAGDSAAAAAKRAAAADLLSQRERLQTIARPLPLLTPLSSLATRPAAFLFPHLLPLGHLTLLATCPGLPASLLLADLIARVSTNAPATSSICNLPSAICHPPTPNSAPVNQLTSQPVNPLPGSVLLLTPDPLLSAALPAAALSRIHLFSVRRPNPAAFAAAASPALAPIFHDHTHDPAPFTLADLPALDAALDQLPDCRLLIIDPLSALLPATICGGAPTLESRLRPLLSALAALAAARNLSVLAVSPPSPTLHSPLSTLYSPPSTPLSTPPSPAARDASLLTRLYASFAPLIWTLIPDPAVPDLHLLLPLKHDLTPTPTALSFTTASSPSANHQIAKSPNHQILNWHAPSPLTPHTLTAALAHVGASARPRHGPAPAQRNRATDLLNSLLSAGPMPVGDTDFPDACPNTLAHAAATAGIAWSTFRRAAGDLGVTSHKGAHGWYWWLPNTPQSERPAPVPLLKRLERIQQAQSLAAGAQGAQEAQVLQGAQEAQVAQGAQEAQEAQEAQVT